MRVTQVDAQTYQIDSNAKYVTPGQINVEGDASSASYFMALGLVGHGPVRVYGVDNQSIQGDVLFTETLIAMGADVVFEPLCIETKRAQGLSKLRAFDQDFNLIPDAAMTAGMNMNSRMTGSTATT